MEALRINRKITSDRIEELNRFKGKNVEIIILSEDEEDKNTVPSILDLQGKLKEQVDGMEFQNRIRKEWER